jgi:DNA-binding transcriptional LysR family regulator
MPIPYTFRQLEYFVAVAGHGSVTAAATACNVSQPSVSVAISELETALGRTLFKRQAGQGLAITPAGRRLLTQAKTILADGYRIARGEHDSVLAGEIAIACFRDLGSIYLPKMLTNFAKSAPNISYRLSEGDLAEVRAQILDGRCDLAITYDIELKSHGIARTVIDRLPPYVLLPRDHPLAMSTQINLRDLSSDRVVIEDFPITREYFENLFRKHGATPRNIQMAPSFEMQRGLVANGWGVGLSCVRPRPDFSSDGTEMICLPMEVSEPAQFVVLAHLGEKTLSIPARQMALAVAESSQLARTVKPGAASPDQIEIDSDDVRSSGDGLWRPSAPRCRPKICRLQTRTMR